MARAKTVNVWFQTRKGGLRCPACNRLLGDQMTEAEHTAIVTGPDASNRLHTAIRTHYTHGWYIRAKWRTGAAFCRGCIADQFRGSEWDAVRIHTGTEYVLTGRGVAVPAWLVVAWSDTVRPTEIVRIA